MNGNFIGKKSVLYPLNRGNDRDTTTDDRGVVSQCHDYFPTWIDRVKFERIGVNPFDIKYKITKQTCLARFILDGSFNCGGPSVSRWAAFIPIEWTWDPPNYTSWIGTVQAVIDATEVSSGCKKGIYVGFLNSYEVCKYKPGVAMKHGGNNDTRHMKVCAYYEAWLLSPIIGRDGYDKNLVGCIDEPFKPIPGTFNTVVPASEEPFVVTQMTVKDLVEEGSRFYSPVVKMIYQYVDRSTSKSYDYELFLRYVFPGDSVSYDPSLKHSSAKVCDKFQSFATTYCAKVPEDDPEKVCVCAKEECTANNFIGCVPRPMPSDSNLKIIGEFFPKKSVTDKGVSILIPALSISLVNTLDDGSVIKRDARGDNAVEKNGTYYKLDASNKITTTPAKDPVEFVRYSLPILKDSVAAEYYEFVSKGPSGKIVKSLTRDAVSAYGFKFSTEIPKLDPNGDVDTVGVITPIQNEKLNGCFVFTSSNDTKVPRYFVPNGRRDKSLCCPAYIQDKRNQCMVPPADTKCKDGSTANNSLIAQYAFCPGTYIEPRNISTVDHICITCDNKNVMPKPYCNPDCR